VLIVEVKDVKPTTKSKKRTVKRAYDKLERYRERLLSLVVPRVEQLFHERQWPGNYEEAIGKLEDCICTAGFFPFLQMSELDVLGSMARHETAMAAEHVANPKRIAEPRWPTMGSQTDAYAWGEIWEVFLETTRAWMNPTFHDAEQGERVHLTAQQRKHAFERKPGCYRLEGPAGSGKTLIVAHKAAHIASQNKTVLIVCFNRILVNYINDQVERMPFAFDRRDISVTNFHELCTDIRYEHERFLTEEEVAIMKNDKDHYFAAVAPRIALDILAGDERRGFRYDAIVIDEGQDFHRDWYKVLSKCLSKPGELLLTRDASQNIYDVDGGWADTPPGADTAGTGLRFHGDWAKLKTTFRMSSEITRVLSSFRRRYLKGEEFEVDPARKPLQKSFDFATPFCEWKNCKKESFPNEVLIAVQRITARNKKYNHPSDIAVLAPTNKIAFALAQHLQESGFPTVHLYDRKGEKSRRKTMAFRKGDGRVKVCTIHSFKGWEVWAVAICVGGGAGRWKTRRELYTAIGRAIGGVRVLNPDNTLNGAERLFENTLGDASP